ncbi:unnamed protein product [Adineta steineri]|uniref:Glycylpeptide N-tetradecanoyltransferase n=1 Tax=Adineta steineri TaxID=433720 RepID=A0A818MJD2_9BILA|nr:unnamed protein product [Adineta steineri]CAF3590252.1 unnamed protein product [Adineta steineri]
MTDQKQTQFDNTNQTKLNDGSIMKSIGDQIADINVNDIAVDSDEEAASEQGWEFWRTQPVTPFGIKVAKGENGPIEKNKHIEQLKQEPYELPDEFSWSEINVSHDEQLKELYTFLNENYVEDNDNMFRFDYSMPLLQWALCSPGWTPKWHVVIRYIESREIAGFYSAAPIKMKVYDKEVPMIESNFLCINKKFRLKRLTPKLITELYRRVNLSGIFQGINTAGALLPGIVSKCLYWHRLINVEKLLSIGFTQLSRGMTLQMMKQMYKLPETTQVKGFRKMRESDIPQAFTLLTQYLKTFDLSPVLTQEEFQYLCQNRPNIVSSFVVKQESGEITDFVSYYHLSVTILNHPQFKTLKQCYLYYYAATRTSLSDLINDCLVQAYKSDCDVFNATDVMDNKTFFKKLQFSAGDGNLQYYIYNWQCPRINSEKIGLILL